MHKVLPPITEHSLRDFITRQFQSCKGSSRPNAHKPYLHGYYNFTESTPETGEQSLRHSCRSPFK